VSLSQLKSRTPQGRKEATEGESIRKTPKPSHPGRVKYTPAPEEASAEVIDLRDGQEMPSEAAPEPAEATKKASRRQTAQKRPPAPLAQTEAPEPPLTVYLDHVHNDFARDVSHAGTRRRPRVSISGAAVIRHALDQLRADMTPEQACQAIAAKLADTKSGEGTAGTQGEKRPRISAYVDSAHRNYVDDVVFASRGQRVRGVNGSTVFRFAMDRLQAGLSADDVCEAIAAKPIDDKATGRKRR
jgi:hypothetical protein